MSRNGVRWVRRWGRYAGDLLIRFGRFRAHVTVWTDAGIGFRVDFYGKPSYNSVQLCLRLILISVCITIPGMSWIRFLPGVGPTPEHPGGGYRSLGFEILFFGGWDAVLWVYFWTGGQLAGSRGIRLMDILFGPTFYETIEQCNETFSVTLPEGTYAVNCTFKTQERSRPRWPLRQRLYRIHGYIADGIPLPPDDYNGSENKYLGFSTDGRTVEEAREFVRSEVLAHRARFGGPDWQPTKGAE